jgi:hypothetical protein
MKSHKYKNGGRITSPYTILFSTIIFCIWLITNPGYDDVYVKEADVFMKPVVVEVEKVPTIKDKIKEYFPRSYKEVYKIAKYESGLGNKLDTFDPKNMSQLSHHNCYYEGKWERQKNGKWVAIVTNSTPLDKQTEGVISTSCKKQDIKMAHSVDCFILMKNYQGRSTCPKDVTLDEHLRQIAEMTTVGGLDIFSSYWTGAYLAIK